jgi:beta-lactamase class A
VATLADVAWNQTTEVKLAPVGVTPGDASGFAGGLRAYLAAQGAGGYGVYLEELSSASTLGAGEGTSMVAASVIKVPEALYLLRQVDQGLTRLEDTVDLRDEDFMGGTGTLYGSAHAGDTLSYGDLLGLLIQQSDNTAWRLLDRVMGASNVDGYAAGIGAGDCRQGGLCSARSAGHMLAQLARGQLLSAASTQRLLSLLESTVFNDRINFYLAGLTIAHKVGMNGGVINDCGVVFLPGDPFAICVFTDTDNPDHGVQVIRDVARAAVRYYARQGRL